MVYELILFYASKILSSTMYFDLALVNHVFNEGQSTLNDSAIY